MESLIRLGHFKKYSGRVAVLHKAKKTLEIIAAFTWLLICQKFVIWLAGGCPDYTNAIAFLAPLAISLGSKLLGKVLGGGKRQPSEVQQTLTGIMNRDKGQFSGAQQALTGIMNQGTGDLMQGVTRQLGKQGALQSSLLSERFSRLPGAGGSALADAATQRVLAGQQEAMNAGLINMEKFNRQQKLQAAGQLANMESQQQAAAAQQKGAIIGGLGQLAGNIGSALIEKGVLFGSSREIKQNIKDADPEELLKKVIQLRVRNFRFKNDTPEDDGREHIFVVAEESPNDISTGREVDLRDTVGLLLGAVQALHTRLAALQNGEAVSRLLQQRATPAKFQERK